MKTVKRIPSLKIITAFLVIALVGCIGYSYHIYNQFENTKRLLINEKNQILIELRNSKNSLDIAIAENSAMKTELMVERQKVTNLLDEVNNSNLDVETLLKYKAEVDRLKGVVASLTIEKAKLSKNNQLLKVQRDSAIIVLTKAKKYNDTLLAMNENLNSVIKKGSKISIVNLNVTTLKQDKKGNFEFTDKANKVNVLKVSFFVIGNKVAKPCEKEYYVQIIDSKNNVLGERRSKKFGPMELDYSFSSPVSFKNETLEVSADLELDKAEKGIYYVNVFDKGDLASKTIFYLK